MHATGYLDTRSRHPVALIAAISINLAIVGGILAYKTEILPRGPEGLPLIPIRPEPPIIKPLDPIKPTPRSTDTRPQPRPIPTDPIPQIDPTNTYQTTWPDIPPLPPIPTEAGPIAKPEPVLPVEVGAQIDKRYAGELQPPYPAGLERQEIQGKVTVRVQVGVDGRVTAVELVSADDPGFFTATKDQALRRWRFKPATRDGKPYVSWVTKTVVFKINRL